MEGRSTWTEAPRLRAHRLPRVLRPKALPKHLSSGRCSRCAGRGMLLVARHDAPSAVLETTDINALATQAG
jgi:hypothetical protein